MPGWQRVYVAACSGVIGFCLGYVLCDFGAWPRLTYFPYEGQWSLVAGPPGPIPMAYVGTIVWGLAGSALAAAAAYGACRMLRRPISDRWLHLWGAWALASFFYGGLYYTWNLWPF